MMNTMLVMFIKFGTPLSPTERAAISMRFIASFNAKELGMTQRAALLALEKEDERCLTTDNIDEERERAKARRRHIHNQMMADNIIQDALATLMSVSSKGELFASIVSKDSTQPATPAENELPNSSSDNRSSNV